jgi:hypothetical protein
MAHLRLFEKLKSNNFLKTRFYFSFLPENGEKAMFFRAEMHRLTKKALFLKWIAYGAFYNYCDLRAVTPLAVDQWTATPKRCSQCGFILPHSVPLSQRTFVCPECHLSLPRDWNAARCIEQLGLTSLDPSNISQFVPTGRREVTPSEMESSTQSLVSLIRQISFVSVQDLSLNKETPSFPASAGVY